MSEPSVEYANLPINIGTSGATGTLNIHPTSNAAKCVGIKGGVYANGTPVDVYASIRDFFSLSKLKVFLQIRLQ